MLNICLIFLFLFFGTIDGNSQLLAKSFQHSGDQQVACTTPTSDGGFIFLLKQDLTIGISTERILLKTDADFNTIWAKSFVATSGILHSTCKIQQVLDGGYLLYFAGNIARFDPFGNPLWQRHFGLGGGYSHSNTCIEKPNGKLVALNSTMADIELFQYSASGILEWRIEIDNYILGGGKNPGFDLLAFIDNSILVSGKTNSDNCYARIDDTGNIIWSNIFYYTSLFSYCRPYSMIEMNDGNIMVAGLRGEKGFFLKMSPVDGTILWQKEVNELIFEDVINIDNSNYALIGKSGTGSDVSLVVVNGDGELVATKTLEGITNENGYPKFIKGNGKNYFTSVTNEFALTNYLSLVEFDSTLLFSCIEKDLTITKTATTLLPIVIGTLNSEFLGAGGLPTPLITNDVFPTLKVFDLCNVFPMYEEVYINSSIPDPIIGENMSSTSLNENSLTEKITVYPNPANQNSPISITLPTGGDYLVQLMDVYGKIIFKNNFNGVSTAISASGLAKGIYLIKVSSTISKHQFTQKLVIE